MKKQYNTKTLGITSAVAVLTTVVSTSAFAWGWGKESRQERMIEHVTQELTLTQTQQDSLKEVTGAFFEIKEQQHDQRKKQQTQKEGQAKVFWSKPNLLAADIVNYVKSAQTERQAKMEQQFKPVAEKLSAFHATLNEQQRGKFAILMAEKMGRLFGGRHGHKGKKRDGKGEEHGGKKYGSDE